MVKIYTAFFLYVVVFLSSNTDIYAQSFTSVGTDFWLGFMPNYQSPQLKLYITAQEDATGNISVPGTGYSYDFSVAANSAIEVIIPNADAYVNVNQTIVNKGIHVTSDQPVSVYMLNYYLHTADASLVYPTQTNGSDYFVSAYAEILGGEFLIVATADNTEVEITPSATTYGGNPAGTTFNVTLDEGECYLVQSSGNLTGSRITGTAPPEDCKKFAVFSGAVCTNVGGCAACDHLVEQMPPITTWGLNFVTVPYKTRVSDYFQVIAAEDNTTFYVNSIPYMLNAGQNMGLTFGDARYISSDKPIMVSQFSRGASCDNTSSDPFYIVLSPTELTLNQITFNAFISSIITNYYLNVVTLTDSVGTVTLDGANIAGNFVTHPYNSDYSYAQIDISDGTHTLVGSEMTAYVYGYGWYESYGYAAGANLKQLNFDLVLDSDTINYNQFADTTCANTPITFIAEYNDDILYYNWNFGDGNTGVGQSITHAYDAAGVYDVWLIVQFATACGPDSLKSTIVIDGLTNAYNSDTICEGNSLLLAAVDADSWAWNTGQTTQSITVTPLSTETYTVTLTGNLQCDTTQQFVVNVENIPDINLQASQPSVCVNDTVSVNLVPPIPPNENPVWTLDGATIISGNANDGYSLLWTTKGTKNITVQATTAFGCTNSQTLVIDVMAWATPALSNPPPQCTGNPMLDLSLYDDDAFVGVWTGAGVSGNLFDPALAGPGNHILVFTPSGACTLPATVTINVAQTLTPNLIVPPVLCTDSPTLDLSLYDDDAFTGIWSGTGISGTSFDPATSGPGNFTITFTPDGSCNLPATIAVNVSPNTTPALTQPPLICSDDTALDLSLYDDDAFTGVWSGTGVSGNSFDPAVSGIGTFTLTFTPNSPCSLPASFDVTVVLATKPQLTQPDTLCTTSLPLDLTLYDDDTFTGTWSGPGLTGPTIFDPATTGAGVFVLVFFPDGLCQQLATLTVNVLPQGIPILITPPNLCNTDLPIDLTLYDDDTFAGTWSGTGVSGNSFDPALAGVGTFALTFTPTGLCNLPSSITITVNLAGQPVLITPPVLCTDSPLLDLTLYDDDAYAGTWAGTGVSGNSFDPAAAGLGSHTLTFTPSGPCLQPATITINIEEKLTPSLTNPNPICVNELPIDLSQYDDDAFTGVWSGAGVSGNSFDPAISGSGTFTLTFTPTGLCNLPATIQIVVVALTTPNITTPILLCQNDPAFDLTTIADPAFTGIWSGVGVSGTIFDPAITGLGSFDIVFTPNEFCAQPTTIQITVQPLWQPQLTQPNSLCQDDLPIDLNVLLEPGLLGVWSGTGVSGNQFDPKLSGTGSFTLTFTASNPPTGVCPQAATIQIAVNPTETPILTQPPLICSADGVIDLNQFADPMFTGTWSGVGMLNGSEFDPLLSGNGSFTFTFTVGGNCGEPATIEITVEQTYIPTPLPLPTACITDPTLDLTLYNDPNMPGKWSGPTIDGNGWFFEPSWLDTGLYQLTYTPTGLLCFEPVVVDITILPSNTPSIQYIAPLCATESVIDLAIYSDPNYIGTWSGDGVDNDIFDPAIAGVGIHTLIFTPQGDCNLPATIDVEVIEPLTPKPLNPNPLCVFDLPADLAPYGDANLPGTWSGPGVSNDYFDPALAGAGVHTLTYTPNDVCTLPATALIEVIAPTLPQLTTPPPLCQGEAPFDLTPYADPNLPGEWSGPGVTGNIFDPSQANSGANWLVFTPTDGVCTLPDSINIAVNPNGIPNLLNPPPICQNAPPIGLTQFADPLYSGTWSGMGVTGGNQFDPALAGVGIHTLSFDPDGVCGDLATTQIEVLPAISIEPTVAYLSAFACNDVFDLDNYVTDANGNPVIGGIWSGGTFISADGIFDPSGLSPGDFTLTIDVIMPNGCPSTATLLVKIANPLTPLAVEPNLNICIDNGLVDLSKLVLPQSGFGVWKGTGVNSVTNQFNPAVVGAGNSVNLTYEPVCNNTTLIDANFTCVTDYSPVCGCDGITYNNPCEAEKKGGVINYTAGPCNLISGGIGGCPQNSQTLTVNIGALPVALLNPPLGVLCNNGGQSFDLDDLIAVGSDLNGVWSISPSVSLSAGNILNPDSLTAGNYTVTYIVAATPPCTEPSSAAQTITIETVSINAGTDFTICGLATSITALGDTNGKWTVTSTPSGTAVVSFATPLALTSDVLVNEPGLYAFTRSATSAGGCIAADTVNVLFTNLLNADIQTICAANQLNYDVVITVTGGSGSYTLLGGSFTGGNPYTITIPSNTPYSIVVDDGADGCPPLNFDGLKDCSCQPDAQLPQPNAINLTFCQGEAIPNFTLSNTGTETFYWLANYNDDISAALAQGLTFTPTKAGTYWVVAVSEGNCPSDKIAVTLTELPKSPIPNNSPYQFCEGQSIGVLVVPNSAGGEIVWQSADGLDDGQSASGFIPNRTTPGLYDYILTEIKTDGSCNSLPTPVSVEILPQVKPILLNISNICETANPLDLLAFVDVNYPNGTWSGTGVAGNSFDPSIAGLGSHILTFTPAGYNCALESNTSITVIDCENCFGIETPVSGNLSTCDGVPIDLTSIEAQLALNGDLTYYSGLAWYADASLTQPLPPDVFNHTKSDKCSPQTVNLYLGALCSLIGTPFPAGSVTITIYPPFDGSLITTTIGDCAPPEISTACSLYEITPVNVPSEVKPGQTGTAEWIVSFAGSTCFSQVITQTYACPSLCPVAALATAPPTEACSQDVITASIAITPDTAILNTDYSVQWLLNGSPIASANNLTVNATLPFTDCEPLIANLEAVVTCINPGGPDQVIAAGTITVQPQFNDGLLTIGNNSCQVPTVTTSCASYNIAPTASVPLVVNPGDNGVAEFEVSGNCFNELITVAYGCPSLNCPTVAAALSSSIAVCEGQIADANNLASWQSAVVINDPDNMANGFAWFTDSGLTQAYNNEPFTYSGDGCTPSSSNLYVVLLCKDGSKIVAGSVAVSVFASPNMADFTQPDPCKLMMSQACSAGVVQLEYETVNGWALQPDEGALKAIWRAYQIGTPDNDGDGEPDCLLLGEVAIPENTLTVNAGQDLTICEGEVVNLSALVNGNPDKIIWTDMNMGGSFELANKPQSEYLPSKIGTYLLAIETKNLCYTSSDTLQLIVLPQQNISVTADLTTIIVGGSTQLNAIGAKTYMWSPAESLSCYDCPMPIATPKVSTTYFVVSTDACTEGNEITIEVLKPNDVEVVNAFSPNNDGVNDTWQLAVQGATIRYEAKIYNRWGQEVFTYVGKSPTDANAGWDGQLQGVPQEAGVYVYSALVVFETEKEPHRFKGNITLIR